MSAARPETGATEQSVQAATKVAEHYAEQIDWTDDRACVIDGWVQDISGDMLAAIVPPTHVIALAEHVVSAADREAIGRAAELVRIGKRLPRPLTSHQRLTLFIEMWTAANAITDADLARLERLGSGGEETR